MSKGVSFRVTNVPDLAAHMEKKGYDDKGLDKLIARAALEIQAGARLRAVVHHGNLKSNISIHASGKHTTSVVATMHYAAFVEFGTGMAGRATDKGPTPSTYIHGSVAGVTSRPFLRPAVVEARKALGL